MNVLTRRLAPALWVLALWFCAVEARAQADPRVVLNGMIVQLQTGTPNPQWYSPEVWQLFAYQTQNSGVYPVLRQLGAVQSVAVVAEQQLPVGGLYSMTALHTGGRSDWRIGINTYTNRVEYVDFAVGQNQPYPLPDMSPIPAAGPSSKPGSKPKVDPDSGKDNPGKDKRADADDKDDRSADAGGDDPRTSDACKQFPNLC